MNTPLNCLTCGATFHQYNLTQKYCSATCRNKALYAKRKQQSAEVQQLSAITEQLVRSQERIKDLETKIQDLKQLEQINEVLRATIQQLTAQPTPSDVDFYLDGDGNKTITIDAIYLSMYSNNVLYSVSRK